jgi:hypothetical protein
MKHSNFHKFCQNHWTQGRMLCTILHMLKMYSDYIPVVNTTRLYRSWCLDDYATPPFRHCDTPTCTIWHCNDSPHIRLHIVTVRPTGVGLSDHPQTAQFGLTSGSKRWLWQSDPGTIRPILCSARRRGLQFGPRHTDGAVKKRRCATRENFTHVWVSRAQAWPNMARPTQQSSA